MAKTFAEIIKERRKAQGMTQKDLGKRLGKRSDRSAQSFVSSLEQNKTTKVDEKMLEKIAEVFGMPHEELKFAQKEKSRSAEMASEMVASIKRWLNKDPDSLKTTKEMMELEGKSSRTWVVAIERAGARPLQIDRGPFFSIVVNALENEGEYRYILLDTPENREDFKKLVINIKKESSKGLKGRLEASFIREPYMGLVQAMFVIYYIKKEGNEEIIGYTVSPLSDDKKNQDLMCIKMTESLLDIAISGFIQTWKDGFVCSVDGNFEIKAPQFASLNEPVIWALP